MKFRNITGVNVLVKRSIANTVIGGIVVCLSSVFSSSVVHAACDQYSPQIIQSLAMPHQTDILAAARSNHVDPNLIKAMITTESCFKPSAVSNKGAGGLMQLMPATARRYGVVNRFDNAENINGGAKYLRWLLNRYNGSIPHAIAAYNAGEGRVDVYGTAVPFRETQDYTRRVLNAYAKLSSGGRVGQPQVAVYRPGVNNAQRVAARYNVNSSNLFQVKPVFASYHAPRPSRAEVGYLQPGAFVQTRGVVSTKADLDSCSVKTNALYTATDNDTVQSIARKYGMDAMQLAKKNGIGKPYALERGQLLRVEVCQRLGGDEEPTAKTVPTTTKKASSTVAISKPDVATDDPWGLGI